MLESIQFRNFKVLRDTTLPLSRVTMIVGPNGSGKSTGFQALKALKESGGSRYNRLVTAGLRVPDDEQVVEITLRWGDPYRGVSTIAQWTIQGAYSLRHVRLSTGSPLPNNEQEILATILAGVRIYSLNAGAIAAPARLQPTMALREDGGHLAGVLDRLRDREPERFDALTQELRRWLPEFDRILFDTPAEGQRAFLLRTRKGHHTIPAADLSQGTLLALAILTIAYLPDPPPMVCL